MISAANIETFSSFLQDRGTQPVPRFLQTQGATSVARVLSSMGISDAPAMAQQLLEQRQVLRFYHELSGSQKKKLLAQLFTGMSFEKFATMRDQAVVGKEDIDFSQLSLPVFEPLPENHNTEVPDGWKQAREQGEKMIQEGKVALLTIAGGDGSRLGHDGPKGTYPTTPITDKSLFEIQASKLLFYRNRFSVDLQWYIMTSTKNHDATVVFFEENDFFGLPHESVHFFSQGNHPVTDEQGKILLSAKDTIATSPNGTGGIVEPLSDHLLDEMDTRGIEHVMMLNVDNALAPVLNPHLLGFHQIHGSSLSCMMVQKSHADEKIGTFSTDKKGGLVVVEYSQLTNEQRYLRDDADQLVHRLGSTGVNVASVKGLREVACTYPFIVHAARKRVGNVLDESGKSSETWGIKYETFLHECYRGFTSADGHPYFVMDAKRDGSFAPVKNLHGVDSPETARRDLMRLHASWLKFSGIEIPRYSDGFPLHGVEVDPMCAVDHMTAREVFQLASCSRRREGMRGYFFTNSQST